MVPINVPKTKRDKLVTDAEKCRRNGWKRGTLLVGDEGYGPTVIRLTAIGDERILARPVSQNGKPSERDWEGSWTLQHRRWRKLGNGNGKGNG